jgi:hypothetical protein
MAGGVRAWARWKIGDGLQAHFQMIARGPSIRLTDTAVKEVYDQRRAAAEAAKPMNRRKVRRSSTDADDSPAPTFPQCPIREYNFRPNGTLASGYGAWLRRNQIDALFNSIRSNLVAVELPFEDGRGFQPTLGPV